MKYQVRSKDGVLTYGSFREVEEAWVMGLIEPDDELLEEGKTQWRRAGSVPLLVQARRRGDQVWAGTWFLWVLVGVIGATGSLALLRSNDTSAQVAGGVLAFAVASVLFRVTVTAAKRSRPHG